MNKGLLSAWAAGAVVLFVVLMLALIGNAAARSDYNDALSEAQARMRLYAAVSGQQLNQPSTERKLGTDVRLYIREHGGQLDGFRGDSNTYGGIAAAVGEDPFDGVNCVECGAFKPDWEERLEQAARGSANPADLANFPSEPNSWVRTISYLFVLWLIVLPGMLGVSWFLGRRRWLESYSAEDRYLIDAINSQLEQGNQDPELLQLRENLQMALDRRMKAGADMKNDMRLDRLKGEARGRLEAIEAGNEYLEGKGDS